MSLNPEDYGAKSNADIGSFLVGASAGGILDAVFNLAGFAEPLVFAVICGGGALGLKKLFESWRE